MDKVVHEQMMSVVNLYLIVGGMPAAVNAYVETQNMQNVIAEQRAIIHSYKRDIGKYDPQEKLYLDDIFELIPSELNAKNKRFILKKLNENFKLSRYQNSFIWMWKAGVAIPTFNVTEPVAPLKLNQQRNLFKLFQNDVGLLAYQYSNGIQMELRSETGIRPLQREPHRTRRHTQSSYLHDNVLQEGRSLDRAIQARHQRLIGITGACYVDGIWNQEDPEKWLTIIQVPVRK